MKEFEIMNSVIDGLQDLNIEVQNSNFEFMKLDSDLSKYYDYASRAEIDFALKKYDEVLLNIRKTTESILEIVMDMNYCPIPIKATYEKKLREIKQTKYGLPKNIIDLFYEIKNSGNVGVHDYKDDRKMSLISLQKYKLILQWYIKTYTDVKLQYTQFLEPKLTNIYKNNQERKIIYIQTADNSSGKWPAYNNAKKIGETTAPSDEQEVDWSPNSEFLRDVTRKRIDSYMKTSGVPYMIDWAELAWIRESKSWFSDRQVHEVLKRSGIKHKSGLNGNEWFEIELDTAKNAIKAVKEGRNSLKLSSKKEIKSIKLRDEQKAAVNQATKAYKKYNKVLWNAKMRFGKTLTAYELIKKNGYRKVLVMTHRPVVSDSWYDDFNKSKMYEEGYEYASVDQGEKSLKNLIEKDVPFIYFMSIQNLGGSSKVGGKFKKHSDFFEIEWDLIIVDEAHEGTKTNRGNELYSKLTKENTKILELTGTPFNILNEYDNNQVFTWDYTMEQQAKLRFSVEHPDEINPYESLPEVSMYTFKMNVDSQFNQKDKYFDFSEFFKVNNKNKFIYETSIKKWLNLITSESKTNYPFATEEYRESIRHTLWLLPNRKSAKALKEIMDYHPIFKEYNVLNIVDDNDEQTFKETMKDLDRVRKAITDEPSSTKTIILTVRKLTTGVNIPPLNGVVFLNNTTSPQSYLQAAFRAQTPFSDKKLGMKKKAYIFDFAPDRALNILAKSVSLSPKAGALNENEKKDKLETLLNFLPVLDSTGNKMQKYSVNNMMRQLKKAYAEKAVLSGFDDASIYNDKLWEINNEDADLINNLNKALGKTKQTKRTKSIEITSSGLSEGEKVKISKAKRKSPNKRTPEEIELLNREKQVKKERENMISILRGISIRIPLMIYGMDKSLDEDITIDEFEKLVDDVSWKEFMPDGITKDDFSKLKRFYDPEIFIEAGHRIRNAAISANNLSYIERIEKITNIFSGFKNPDKETVLTPWRIVNLQMGKTLGGFNFFNDSYTDLLDNVSYRYIELDDITNDAFSEDTKVLEINSKTGLYPLYIAFTIYQKRFLKESSLWNKAEYVQKDNELWREVLQKNIYVINKSPMAKTITYRTLNGYDKNDEFYKNLIYIPNILEKLRNSNRNSNNIIKLKNEILNKFGDENLKFDVVIGNPPYQEETNNNSMKAGQQKRVRNVFQDFQFLADSLSCKYSSLIYPGGRWIHQSGKGMKEFGYQQINSNTLSKLIYYPNANNIFSDVLISDGISIVFKDYLKITNQFKYEYIDGNDAISTLITAPGDKLFVLNPRYHSIVDKVENLIMKNKLKRLSQSNVINQKLFQIESDFVEKNPNKVEILNGQKYDSSTKIKLLTNDKAGKTGRAKWFIVNKNLIKSNVHLIDKWKVIVSSANAGGQKRDRQLEIIDNNSAFGRSRIALKAFDTFDEARNFYNYVDSKVIQFLFLMSDESLTSLARVVPDFEDYSNTNKFIDYKKDIDEQLKIIFGISEFEYDIILEEINKLKRSRK